MPAAAAYPRAKPAMQLYRPPTLRAPDDLGSPTDDSPRPGLNINAKEFISQGDASPPPPQGGASPPPPQRGNLRHSKSSTQVGHTKGPLRIPSNRMGGGSPPLRVQFNETTTLDPGRKAGMTVGTTLPHPMKRSKSLGSAADLLPVNTKALALAAVRDLQPLQPQVQQDLLKVAEDPAGAPARLVMESMRQLFNRLAAGSQFAEPAGRYCTAVIEKEGDGEVFLETLLNTCQEYYQEREKLLCPSAHPPVKWIGYMTFLHEMYSQLKRRRKGQKLSSPPSSLLLSLLAECCIVTLQQPPSLHQTECLFFTLTGVGRDLEAALPTLLDKVMNAARDALFQNGKIPAVRKTLLQLIEMNAASWQLPAPAVMYYYPTGSGK